jgi:hypothetical protein
MGDVDRGAALGMSIPALEKKIGEKACDAFSPLVFICVITGDCL